MNNTVTICIGTIGAPTFDRCKRSVEEIARRDPRVKRVVVIKDKKPQSAWLNEMRTQCKDTKWCLQVDEDMYLYKNALDDLVRFAEKKEREGVSILNASSLLYDLFLKQKIGSLKLWSSKALQEQSFNDVLGGDRDYAKRAKRKGFRNVEISVVLGDHDSAPNASIAFSKYYEYTQKIRRFKSDSSAEKFSNMLKRKWKKDGCYISKKAYDGSKHGLIDPVRNKSKS